MSIFVGNTRDSEAYRAGDRDELGIELIERVTPELDAAQDEEEGLPAQEQPVQEPEEEEPQEEHPEGADLQGEEAEEEVQVEEAPPEKEASDHDQDLDGEDSVHEMEMVEDSEAEVEQKPPDRKGKNSKGGKGKKEKGKGKSKARNKGKGKAGKKDGNKDRGDRQGHRGHEGRGHIYKSQGQRRREGRDWKDQDPRSKWLKREGKAPTWKRGTSVWSEEAEEPLHWSEEEEEADEEPVRVRSSSARSANPRLPPVPKAMPKLAGRGVVVLPPRKKPRNDEDPSTAGK